MMRNALICAGGMLAVLLLWPLIFSGRAGAEPSPQRGASTVAITIPDARPARNLPNAVAAAMPPVRPGRLATCGERHAHVARLCAPQDGGCRARATDALDICEATGFWPA